jgi:hypothetical protein
MRRMVPFCVEAGFVGNIGVFQGRLGEVCLMVSDLNGSGKGHGGEAFYECF